VFYTLLSYSPNIHLVHLYHHDWRTRLVFYFLNTHPYELTHYIIRHFSLPFYSDIYWTFKYIFYYYTTAIYLSSLSSILFNFLSENCNKIYIWIIALILVYNPFLSLRILYDFRHIYNLFYIKLSSKQQGKHRIIILRIRTTTNRSCSRDSQIFWWIWLRANWEKSSNYLEFNGQHCFFRFIYLEKKLNFEYISHSLPLIKPITLRWSEGPFTIVTARSRRE
jgi:hypothetical protein